MVPPQAGPPEAGGKAQELIAEDIAQRPKIRLDMHTHTEYSPDSRTTLARFAAAAKAAGLGAVCVTDHNTVAGALRLREMDTGFRVVVGEEIYSLDGEIVGLFLEEAVPPHLPASETMDRIHAQGGLVYIPHPFSRNRLRHMKIEQLNALVDKIDAVEVFNAREMSKTSNAKALAFAVAHAKPGGVGSDSHRRSELGRAYVEVADFTSPAELLEALRQGTVTGKLSGMFMHVRTWGDAATKVAIRLLRRTRGG
ncbi:MAG TPA: PHP domain-containing protein [Candidatus Limnocylindria bacterium]|nr:PHP domain-containing protein [Candidatus Limnocylindria bacterium]